MEILTTLEFADRVKVTSKSCKMKLHELAEKAEPLSQPCTERLDGCYLVGWTRDPNQLAFWYLLSDQDVKAPAKKNRASYPLASFSRAEIRAMGVSDVLVAKVQRLKSLIDLESLGLAKSVCQRLRFVFLQRLYGLEAIGGDLVRRATDLKHFDMFLHGNITELQLRLDKTQRRIVELEGDGTIIVRGVAGSGKTAVALHRIVHLLRQRSLLTPPRILFITYNRSLVGFAGELLQALGIKSGEVEVSTLHAMCLKAIEKKTELLKDADRRRLILEACTEVRTHERDSALWSYPEAFWQEEIHLIKGRGTEDLQQYLRISRFGAGRALDKNLRELVWEVYIEYQKLCFRNQVIDWDDVVKLAYEKLSGEHKDKGCYDYVFVDEAQDLTVMGLKVANLQVRPKGSLFIAYDRAQSIYEKVGFRWKDCGIKLHGSRSIDLKRNFRNTMRILQAAGPLLDGIDRDRIGEEHEEGEEILRPMNSTHVGEEPRLLASTTGREIQVLCDDIAASIEKESIPPQNIAVLCYPNKVRDLIAAHMEKEDIIFQKHTNKDQIRLSDPSVKVLPIKSAKGLEFPVVYILASARWYRPHTELDDEEREAYLVNLRKIFYMAMTRAMTKLVLVYDKNDPVEFIHHLL